MILFFKPTQFGSTFHLSILPFSRTGKLVFSLNILLESPKTWRFCEQLTQSCAFIFYKKFSEFMNVFLLLATYVGYIASSMFASQGLFRCTFINPFVPNARLFYSLKTSENHMVFWCFQGLEKECIGNKWIK